MLVLSRKKNQKIVIGDNITITVVEVSRGTVRLGIEAPKEVTVHRQEVYEALRKQSDSQRGSAAGSESQSPSEDVSSESQG